MNFGFILYTHTDYKDVWPIFFGQAKKYINNERKYAFVNKEDSGIPKDYKQLFYNDYQSYTNRIVECLEGVEEEYVLFQHEDMFLYEAPNIKEIEKICDVMQTETVDFVKLIKGGETRDIPYGNHKKLFLIPFNSNFLFTIQPTLCRVSSMKRLFAGANTNIWSFESSCQAVCRSCKFKCLYTFDGEPLRGRYHHDSVIYPYVATAIVKGKWNYSEYSAELNKIFSEYNIDKNRRGIR